MPGTLADILALAHPVPALVSRCRMMLLLAGMAWELMYCG